MPVQQISVVPAKETASNGKSAQRSKDKNEGKKAPGRSGSRSSNISKASNSTTGVNTNSRTSISPSSQDICSLKRLEEDASESLQHDAHTPTPEMTVSQTSAALGSSAQAQKKQVKRRHRRKRSGGGVLDGSEPNGKQEQTDRSDRSLSSDRSERGEKREKSRRELAPRLRCAGAAQSGSSSEEEAWPESRSWSKEKARRARRRSSRGKDGAGSGKEGDDRTEVMELQSVGSDEEGESRPPVEGGGGLKKRHSGCSTKRDESQSGDKERSSQKSQSPGGSSSPAEDGEELITKRYQERGSGSADMSVPAPQEHCAANGGATHYCSDDSEGEVCRICHCEGDDECPLIMPCRCTGSLSFVHQTCLNQWIKSSDTRCCELCKFDFVMETRLKPLRRWEKLQMTKSERRKIFCSVLFHLIAIACMLWSVYILVKRTAEEIRLGKDGILEWPFWTKLIVVAIGFTGGLIFMYIQCKVYLQLWRRLKAFNRIITVQNCPEKDLHQPQQSHAGSQPNGRLGAAEVPVSPASPDRQAQVDSDSVEEAVAPVRNPV